MNRRRFLARGATMLLSGSATMATARAATSGDSRDAMRTITLFLCGDVMTGRGIDQILRHPSRPELYEPSVTSALDYVALAERGRAPLPRRVDPAYVWGDALRILGEVRPDARIVNLETAVTAHDTPWPGKVIQYRMHPANVDCLTAAALDCCALANNHVMDWGREGLAETLATLHGAGLRTAGAGRNLQEAAAPAVIDVAGKGRVLVFAYGMRSAGIPGAWAANHRRSGVNLLDDLSPSGADAVTRHVRGFKRDGDVVVMSLHWGGNWGYAIRPDERRFAQALIDAGAVDVLHGHSSHHPRGIEVRGDKPILYGCGDFLDDYEGIGGHEAYRGELGCMYFPTIDAATGRLRSFAIAPTRIARFRVNRASEADAGWIASVLDREGRELGTRVGRRDGDLFALAWT